MILNDYQSHPSIVAINEMCSDGDKFDFKTINCEEMHKYINKLNSKKSTPQEDIPAEILKQFSGIYTDLFTQLYNSSHATGLFPDGLKIADVSPFFKKGAKSSKSNYADHTFMFEH